MRPFNHGPGLFPGALLLGICVLCALSGCTSHRESAEQAGNLNFKLTIEPQNSTLYVGKAQQFIAKCPYGGSASWAVFPASGGSFDANGLFTPKGAPGTYQIVAMWNNDARFTASTGLTLVPPPLPPKTDPNITQASGGEQGAGAMVNAVVVGETTPARTSRDATGHLEVRHGFAPPTR